MFVTPSKEDTPSVSPCIHTLPSVESCRVSEVEFSSTLSTPSMLLPCSTLINTHPHWHAAQHIKNTYFDMWCSSPSHCLCETHTLIHQCVHGCIRLILPTQVPDCSCVYRKLCLQKTNHTWTQRLWQKASILMLYLNYTEHKNCSLYARNDQQQCINQYIILTCDLRTKIKCKSLH